MACWCCCNLDILLQFLTLDSLLFREYGLWLSIRNNCHHVSFGYDCGNFLFLTGFSLFPKLNKIHHLRLKCIYSTHQHSFSVFRIRKRGHTNLYGSDWLGQVPDPPRICSIWNNRSTSIFTGAIDSSIKWF